RTYDSLGRLAYSKTNVIETGTGLNHNYTVETTISSYNSLGQILRMTTTTVDDGLTTTETDTTGRTYDSLGRLAYSKTNVIETGTGLNHNYTVETTISSYNSLGQILRMRQITIDGGLKTTEQDSIYRRYDSLGRLTYSNVSITETDTATDGTILNHNYIVETFINAVAAIGGVTDYYNSLGQIIRMVRKTYDGDKVTWEVDDADRQYDSQGWLSYSCIRYLEELKEGADLSHTCTIETFLTESDYNSLGQILTMTRKIVDDALITIETDTANRTYDANGRLTYSCVSVTEKDPTAAALNHTYTVATTISDYNALGQILNMAQVTVDDGLTTTETDTADRTYYISGLLKSSSVSIAESGTNLNHNYTVETIINSYNSLGQVLRMAQITVDNGLTTTMIDNADRVYHVTGYLYSSSVTIIETGNGLDHSYTLYTIQSYNVFDQIAMTDRVIVDNGLITIEQDIWARTYDANGRLTYSCVSVTEKDPTAATLNHTYTVETTIASSDYNSLGQILRMTTTTVNDALITIETDTANRTYDANGRLTYSCVSVTEKDPTAATLNHTYTVETFISSIAAIGGVTDYYNSLGQVVRMVQKTYDGDLITWTVDDADRQYNTQGQLSYSYVRYLGQSTDGITLNHTYTVETTIDNYDTLEQVLQMKIVTVDGGLITIEDDADNRLYYSSGQLKYSYVNVTESGAGLNNCYTISTTIDEYNTLGQVLKMGQITIEDGGEIIEMYDVNKRIYDSNGRLYSSKSSYYDHYGTNVDKNDVLNETYVIENIWITYTAYDQVAKTQQKTYERGKTTTVTDTSDRTYYNNGRIDTSAQDVLEEGNGLYAASSQTTHVISYNSLGQVLQMETSTTVGSKKTTGTDLENRTYDSDGYLVYSKIGIHEGDTTSQGRLDNLYIQTTEVLQYNGLHQVVQQKQVTTETDGSNATTVTSTRQHDIYGRVSSLTETTSYIGTYYYYTIETTTYYAGDEVYDSSTGKTYKVYSTIEWQTLVTHQATGTVSGTSTTTFTYNDLDQVEYSTISTVYSDSSVVQKDTVPRRYNSIGELIYSEVVISGTGTSYKTELKPESFSVEYPIYELKRLWDAEKKEWYYDDVLIGYETVVYISYNQYISQTTTSTSSTVETIINSYNDLGQITKKTVNTTGDGDTETEVISPVYNITGREVNSDEITLSGDSIMAQYLGYWYYSYGANIGTGEGYYDVDWTSSAYAESPSYNPSYPQYDPPTDFNADIDWYANMAYNNVINMFCPIDYESYLQKNYQQYKAYENYKDSIIEWETQALEEYFVACNDVYYAGTTNSNSPGGITPSIGDDPEEFQAELMIAYDNLDLYISLSQLTAEIAAANEAFIWGQFAMASGDLYVNGFGNPGVAYSFGDVGLSTIPSYDFSSFDIGSYDFDSYY
ncbi:MAG: hypothetical protein PHS46_08135, partial [Candidatus Omnitrophica bacterium]|nr:hypothetical protein [Candidatus Omnitrophota bacterium]